MPKRGKRHEAARPPQDGPSAADSTPEAWMEPLGRPGPDVGLLYLGGPVDFNLENHAKAWQHWPDWALTGLYPYCPRCECQGLTDEQIMEKNRRAVMRAEFAIFDLRSHSVGTPIEMYMRVWRRQKPSLIIGSDLSVFIRYTSHQFEVAVSKDPHAALQETRRLFG